MSDFRKAIETVISVHEGGFQNRADDPGNYDRNGELKGTKYGISAHSFPGVDIENLTLNDAEDLYRRVWGEFAVLEDQQVLTKVLDLAVNMQWAGHGPATKILQQACNRLGFNLVVDSAFGPSTAAAANAANPKALLEELTKAAGDHYLEIEATKPEMKAWFENWSERAGWIPPQEITA